MSKMSTQTAKLVEEPSKVKAACSDKSGNTLYETLLKADESEAINSYRIEPLKNCVWVGHTNTDLDSVASAIGAAYLFKGIAARASESLNGETEFVLNEFGIERPPLYKSIDEKARERTCLVDHNQITQMAESVNVKHVKAVFDHHALQKNTLSTDSPILIDIKPWGSTCTIIARQFWKERKMIPKHIASLLLAGILSDTLNLRSPTATEVDRVMVCMLSRCAELDESGVDSLALRMFSAKAEAFNDLSAHALVLGDHKIFALQDIDRDPLKLGFGVVETTSVDVIIRRKEEILHELAAVRKEQTLDFSFLAVVDTLKLESFLLLCGPSETELAKLSFLDGKMAEESVLYIGSRVSRKLDFIPALDSCLQQHHVELGRVSKEQSVAEELIEYGPVVVEHADSCVGCCIPRRKVPSIRAVGASIAFVRSLARSSAEQSRLSATVHKKTRLGITIALYLSWIALLRISHA